MMQHDRERLWRKALKNADMPFIPMPYWGQRGTTDAMRGVAAKVLGDRYDPERLERLAGSSRRDLGEVLLYAAAHNSMPRFPSREEWREAGWLSLEHEPPAMGRGIVMSNAEGGQKLAVYDGYTEKGMIYWRDMHDVPNIWEGEKALSTEVDYATSGAAPDKVPLVKGLLQRLFKAWIGQGSK